MAKSTGNEKGDTKELDLTALKKALAKEEAELKRTKRLKQLEQERKLNEQEKAASAPIDREDDSLLLFNTSTHSDKTTQAAVESPEGKPQTPEELREARRRYWKEKQKQEQLEKTPYHHYPILFYTSFWLRLFAYSIDLLVIGSLNRLIVHPVFTSARLPVYTEAFSAFSLSKLFVFLLYFILMTKLTNGQTIGKMIFGLRVVCFKEEKLSWQTVLIREGFGRYILKSMSILYLVVLFTERKQQVADLLSDTSVVSENLLQAKQWGQSSSSNPSLNSFSS